MELHGHNFVGNLTTADGAAAFSAFNPATGAALTPMFHVAMEAEVNCAVELAEASFAIYRASPASARAAFLDHIADELLGLGDAVIERAHQETALTVARLTGERVRTVNQLRM